MACDFCKWEEKCLECEGRRRRSVRFKLQGGMGASRDDALFFLFPCPQNAMNELPPPPAPDADALSPDAVDVLLRRWNAQVKHLRADDRIPSHRFDLAVTDDQPFSAARLKSNIERCLIIVAKLKTCGREMARLRSWDDPGRTAAFCSVSDDDVPEMPTQLTPVSEGLLPRMVLPDRRRTRVGRHPHPPHRAPLLPPPPLPALGHTHSRLHRKRN